MNIFNINGNNLLLINNLIIINNKLIINELLTKNLDTAILYKHIEKNIFSISILEKDNSTSLMCGNGCIAMGLYFMQKFTDIVLINELKQKVYVKISDNKIIFNLNITHKEKNLFIISGEPHKIYFQKNYDLNEHLKLGKQNIPNCNTTILYKLNDKYYYSTFERGVNKITNACGTGSFASIYYINEIIKDKISIIYTKNDKEYLFNKINKNFFLITNIKNLN